jgi:predicted permease
MAAVGEWLRRIGYLLNRGRLEAALEEEMRAHRAMMGQPARFGNTLALRERSRDIWGWNWLDAIVRDVRFAARGLLRTPVFTIAATLSLALGLALTATTVAIVNAYLIRTLPYTAVERLYHLRYAPPGPWEPSGMTALDWSAVQDVVEYPIAAAGDTFYVDATGEGGHSMALRGLRAPRSFVQGLGVPVAAGRALRPEDFVSGAEPVALLGHTVWRDRFGADPAAIGRVIRMVTESQPDVPQAVRIVGVIAPGFYFGRDRRAGLVELMLPHPAPVRTYMVRLREGVPPAAAEERLTEAARRAATSPLPPDWTGVELESVRDRSIGTLRPVLFGVTAAVALVLLIVCANVAVLMLLRAMQRQREVAVRLALGSGRRHIARMLLAETSLLCGSALVCGIGLTALALGTVAPLVETELGRPAPGAAGITLDATVLAIVGAVSVVAAVLLSLAPVAPVAPMSSWGRRLTNALSQDARVASESRPMRRVRTGLMVFEIAGALVLLVGCGLMVRSVVQMLSTDLGFEADGLRASRIMLRARNHAGPEGFRSFHERFAQNLGATAGSPVAFSSWPPFVPPPEHLMEADTADAPPLAGTIAVSSGYFSVFEIPFRQGRDFTPADASAEAPVAIVSESLARRLWPGGSALGRRVRNVERTPGGDRPGPWRTVVGVVGDVRQTYDDGMRRDFYWPRTPDGRYGTFYLRTARPGPELYADFQQVAAELDRDAVINAPRVVADENEALAGTRFMTYLLSAFAGGAALLAMLGIYGVTAYAAQQRRKEIAIRIALGATDRAVTAIFLQQGAWLLAGGICAGVAGALLMSRFLRSQVFGISSFDLPTYAAASLLLAAAGLAAVVQAARAAMARHPLRALNAG